MADEQRQAKRIKVASLSANDTKVLKEWKDFQDGNDGRNPSQHEVAERALYYRVKRVRGKQPATDDQAALLSELIPKVDLPAESQPETGDMTSSDTLVLE